jgi:hypothetical protein
LVQFNNFFCNMFSHLHNIMHTASTKQGHPHNSMWCTEHHVNQITCLLQTASLSKKINNADIVLNCCRNT